jgi:hypothetical protein
MTMRGSGTNAQAEVMIEIMGILALAWVGAVVEDEE